MNLFGYDIEVRDVRIPKHLRNRSLEQITLRRDIARLCSERKDEMTFKEMQVVVNDVRKTLGKLSNKQKGE